MIYLIGNSIPISPLTSAPALFALALLRGYTGYRKPQGKPAKLCLVALNFSMRNPKYHLKKKLYRSKTRVSMRCRHNYFLRICVIDWTMKTMLEKKMVTVSCFGRVLNIPFPIFLNALRANDSVYYTNSGKSPKSRFYFHFHIL